MRIWLVILLTLSLPCANAQQGEVRDDAWREKHLWETKDRIKQGDFGPIDEAFKARDLDLLWSYYLGSDNILYHTHRRVTPERLAKATGDEARRLATAIAREKYAAAYLLQIPEHARHVGDWIEKSAIQKGLDQKRGLRISALVRLGSDESIVELGRFIFDDRNPDYTPPVDSRPVYPLGIPSAIQYTAVGALGGALRGKYSIVEEVSEQFGLKPDWFEKIRNWWLHSDEAAPYRRKLADSGVVLPPGYPPMAELKGAKTTIAPSTSAPPVPVVQQTSTPPKRAEPSTLQAETDKESNEWRGWYFIVLLLALLAAPLWLAWRRKHA